MSRRISGITIEIDGDTSKLGKALKDTNKDLRDVQSQLREVDRGLRFQPGNTELLGQKFKLLTNQVEETRTKLDTLKKADEQAKQQLAKGEIGQDQYDALRREIIKTEDQLKSLERQASETQKELQGKGWTDFGEKLDKAGQKATEFGKGLTKKVTAPILAVGTASAAVWGEIDDALDSIATGTGATGEELAALQDTFRKVYGTIPGSAADAATAVAELDTAFGDNIKNLEEASGLALKFADINGTDVTAAIQGAKKSMEVMGLGADDLAGALDIVTVASQNTGVSVDTIFESMRANAPILQEMGISYEEAALMIGEMEKNGLKADQVLKGLQRGQTRAAKSGRSLSDVVGDLQAAMESGADETELLAMAAEAFGDRSAPIMLQALEAGAIDLEAFAETAASAGGSVNKTFEETLDPIDKAKLALDNLKLVGADLFSAVQEVAAPMLEKLAEGARKFSEWFNKLDSSTQEMIVKIGLIAAAIGPLFAIGGKLLSGMGSIFKTIGSLGGAVSGFGSVLGAVFSPTGLIIAGVIAAGVLIVKNWDTIKEKAGQLASWIGEKWDNIKSWTSEKWNNVKDTIGGAWQNIKERSKDGWETVKKGVSDTWDNVKNWTSEKWGNVKDTVSNSWKNIKERSKDGWENVKTGVSGAWDNIKTKTSNTWENIKETVTGRWDAMKDGARSGAEKVRDAISSRWDKLKDHTRESRKIVNGIMTGDWDGVSEEARRGAEKVSNAIGGAWEGLKEKSRQAFASIKGWISDTWSNITGGNKNYGGAGGSLATGPGSGTGAGGSFGGGYGPMASLLEASRRVLPGLEWYDKGGIFTGPAIIGVGEKRPEAVGALDDIKGLFLSALKEFTGSAQTPVMVTGNNFTVREEADIDRIADALYRKIDEAKRGF